MMEMFDHLEILGGHIYNSNESDNTSTIYSNDTGNELDDADNDLDNDMANDLDNDVDNELDDADSDSPNDFFNGGDDDEPAFASEHYKKLLVIHDPNSKTIMDCLDIVKKYVIREKLIIVGGMAIDFALRLKGHKLYEDDDIPDYDFITPHHWTDAYEIAQWLNRINITNLSVINAQHPTTMRVRVNAIAVADVTYVPANIYEHVPRLNYKQFDFVHPFYQYIDQHRSLSMAFENLDTDRPVIINRWKKDMKRYDMLWNLYPLKWEGRSDDNPNSMLALDVEKVLPFDVVADQCINGFLALRYWTYWAQDKYGYSVRLKPTPSDSVRSKPSDSIADLGKCHISDAGIVYTIPVDSHGVTLYTNNIKELQQLICKKYKVKNKRFYEQFIDKIPRKVILDNSWELLDNNNQWIAAHKVSQSQHSFYVANLQTIMVYMLVNYILLNKIKKEERGYAFYAGYMACRDLLKFGADHEIAELLPTTEYYGKDNKTESNQLSILKFKQKMNIKVDVPRQPHHVYDRDMRNRKVPDAYYDFKPDSEIFRMDGEVRSAND